jgi:carbohydrate diacid regulator
MRVGLTEQLAQTIVERSMVAIPYNINVMNAEGVIIASGDIKRVGQLHQGALKAIHLNGLFEVRHMTMADKPGVNVPIKYQDEIVGVIGISGEPDTVRSLGHVLKVIAELIIEQQYVIKNDLHANIEFENFLLEWCSTAREHYTEDFRRRAEERGVNLEAHRTAAVIELSQANPPPPETFASYIREGEYAFGYKGNILMLFQNTQGLDARLERIAGHFEAVLTIGIGEKTSDVANSVKKAQKAISIAKRCGLEKRLVYFRECIIFDMISNYPEQDTLREVVTNLERKFGSDELFQTLTAFFKYNGDVKLITEELHIHRNTLSYRLKKIEEFSGKDIKVFEDLFYLYVASMVSGLKA